MKCRYVIFILFLTLVGSSLIGTADRLPNQTPENQIFSVDTVIDATGLIDSQSDSVGLVTTPGAIEDRNLANHDVIGATTRYSYPIGKVIADVKYKDSVLTNGGKIAENSNFGYDSRDKTLGLYNVEASKVLTYGTTEGAHMVGEEENTLSIAGEAKKDTGNIRCVFSTGPGWLPPFCNIVSAKSSLININSAQVSARGQMRAIAAADDIPAELNYQIAVTPDANSGSGFAEGTVKTTFAGSIMEGRGSGMYWTERGAHNYNTQFGTSYKAGEEIPWEVVKNYPGGWDKIFENSPVWGTEVTFGPSATNSWKDSTEVTGGIKNLQKSFAYKSGFRL